jgi:hypothetical protein
MIDFMKQFLRISSFNKKLGGPDLRPTAPSMLSGNQKATQTAHIDLFDGLKLRCLLMFRCPALIHIAFWGLLKVKLLLR